MSPAAASARCKALAVLMVAVLTGGNLAGYLHQITERHARCPEHGELVHVAAAQLAGASGAGASGAGVSAGHPPDRRHSDSHPDSTLQRSAGLDLDHEHEHCYLCPSSRERIGPATTFPLETGAVPESPGYGRATCAPLAAAAIYGLAPKTSPPV